MVLEHRESACATVDRIRLVALAWVAAAVLITLPAAGQGTWEPVVGGGAATPNGFGSPANQAASAMAEFAGRLFVAAGGDAGSPFVMRSTADGVGWDVVTDDGFGDVGNQGVAAMAVFDGRLYAGTTNPTTGAEIWRTADGVVWNQVNASGFGSAANSAVTTFTVFSGQLYAGLQNSAIGGGIYRSPDGTSWIPTLLGGFGDAANVAVTSLAGYGSRFYAGTYRESVLYNQPGELWWTDDFLTWHSAAAAGFGDSYNVAIVSLKELGGYLFAGTSQLNFLLGNGCEVWRWDGQIWILVNVPGFGSSETTTALRLEEFLGELYVGVDNQLSGGKVYRYLGPMSWMAETTDGFGDPGNLAVSSLASFGSDLYAGTVNQSAGCEVWRRQGPIFADGFESGDTGAWSSTVP
jgi:hypothetical protein